MGKIESFFLRSYNKNKQSFTRKNHHFINAGLPGGKHRKKKNDLLVALFLCSREQKVQKN